MPQRGQRLAGQAERAHPPHRIGGGCGNRLLDRLRAGRWLGGGGLNGGLRIR